MRLTGYVNEEKSETWLLSQTIYKNKFNIFCISKCGKWNL